MCLISILQRLSFTMKKRLLFCYFLLSTSLLSLAQDGYSIKIKMQGAPENKFCHLAHFFGNNQYIKVDSAKMENGVFNFHGKDKLKGGIYLFVLSPSKYYDFAVSGTEQNFEFEADTTNYVKSVKFKGSKENNVLFEYRKYLREKSDEAEMLTMTSQLKNDPISKELTRTKISALQKEVADKMKSLVADNKDKFTSKIIAANIEPELPTELPKKANGRPDSTYLFNYYKNHFFDNIDFKDERMVRTPFIQNRLERYFKELVYQIKDSVNHDCDKVLAMAKPNKEVYRYTLWWITNKYENPEVVGLDGVFIHLAENYYMKDADWLDSTQRAKFKERVEILKPLQTGLVFPALVVADTLGIETSAMASKGKYTVVVFYSPDCGHCKESAPKLVDFYNKNKANGVEVYFVSVDYDLEKMKKFVQTYKTQDLKNLWDSKGRYYFRNNFDVYSTPTTYVLDKDKRIVGKRIPIEDLEGFLKFYERQQAMK